jgi:acetolactate synthase-1/3 small subunit
LTTSQVPVWAVLDYTKTSTISRELLLAKVSVLGPEYAEQQMSGGPTHSAHSNDAVHDYLPTNEGTEKFQAEQALAQNFESSGGLPPSLSSYNGRQQQGGHQGHALSQSEALIAKNLHLNAIKTLTDQFGGRLVDVAENSVIVELTAKSSRVEAFLSLLRPFGILEAARSGESSAPGGRMSIDAKSWLIRVVFIPPLPENLTISFDDTGSMVMPRTPIPRNNYDDDEPAEVAALDASLLPPG